MLYKEKPVLACVSDSNVIPKKNFVQKRYLPFSDEPISQQTSGNLINNFDKVTKFFYEYLTW
ncbi:MAG TPA: hypothetical protein DD706_19590 [Nitrospiraceae bacterium]|nr:hypothetical protein [Nitrospiraceae bacterium]